MARGIMRNLQKEAETASKSKTDGSPVRKRILDAAFGAFLERGYAEASTLEIATRAKVSKRELYAHFDNKQALFAAGIKERTGQMRVPLELPDITTRNSLAATLEAYGKAVLTTIVHPHVLAVHRLAIAESARTPELAATLEREGRQANYRALADLLRKAQRVGLIDGADPEDMAGQYSSLLWGDLYLRLLLRVAGEPSLKQIERRAKRATELFLRLHPGSA